MEISDKFRRKIGLIFTELANTGQYLIEIGHYERAIQVFLTLSDGDPTFEAGTYAYNLGVCYEKLNKLTKAKEYFDIAARENPAIPKYVSAAAKYR